MSLVFTFICLLHIYVHLFKILTHIDRRSCQVEANGVRVEKTRRSIRSYCSRLYSNEEAGGGNEGH